MLKKRNKKLLSTLLYGIPLAFYAILLILPLPAEAGLAFRYDFSSVLWIVFLLLITAFMRQGKWGWTFGMLTALFFFGLPLSGLWGSGKSEFGLIEGLLPWSDANGYYIGAQRLIEGLQFSSLAARRPLFPGLLSSLLAISGQNLQITLAVLTAFNGLACTLLAFEVRKTHGNLAGVITLMVNFIFYRRFVGMTLTENLGLALGAVSLAVLWNAINTKSTWRAAIGILFLTLALIARAGAFMILPTLVIWGGIYFRGKRLINLRFIGLGSGAILLGFILNALLMTVVVTPGSQAFSNFSTTFYGLSVGGKGWLQVEKDHPEITHLPSGERPNAIYKLAFKEILSNPGNLIKGMFVTWKNYFQAGDLGAYGYVKAENKTITLISRVILFLLGFACLSLAMFNFQIGFNSLLFFSMIGIYLSIPFVPPGDADYMRAYAATIPFTAVLPAVGFYSLSKAVKLEYWTGYPLGVSADDGALGLGIILVVLSIAGPLLIRAVQPQQVFKDYSCEAGQDRVVVRISRGSYVLLVNDDKETRLPDIRQNDFIRNAHDHPEWLVTTELDRLIPVTLLSDNLDIYGNRNVYLMMKEDLIPEKLPALLNICGRWSDDKKASAYGFFTAEKANLVGMN